RRRTIEKREAQGQQGENEKHGDEAPQPAPDEQATAPPRSLAPRFRTLFRFHHRYPHTILRSFFLPEYREPQGLAMPKASGLDGDGEWGHRSAMQEMTPLSFDELLAVHAGAVEDLLRNLLDERPREGEIARPERLLAAMRHGALNGGKRLRPFLLIESARLFGAQGEAVLRVAAALECVHCYSLVHDDLPAMDDDDLRRGQPTVHRAFDEATAILAGDSLLTYAFDIIAD